MHLNEQKIELYFLNAPEVEADRSKIEEHIKLCPGCRELYDEIATYYKDVETDLAAQQNVGLILKKNFPTLSEQSLIKEFRQWVANREVNMALPVRIARWVVRHPYISGGATLTFFGAMIAGMLMLVSPQQTSIRDMNPTHVEFKGEMMIIENKYGEPIGEERIPGGNSEIVDFYDVDKDSVNEVIWAQSLPSKYGNASNVFSLVVCKSISQGKILWSDTLRKKIVFSGDSTTYFDKFHCIRIKAGDNDADGKPEVYVLSHDADNYPGVLFKFDANTGKELGAFVHAGQLKELKFLDIQNDGITEILTMGTNNAFNNACIIILDPRFISGYALATNQYIPEEYQPATEYAYIRIPKTQFSEAVKEVTQRNFAVKPEIYETSKMFHVWINDFSYANETAKLQLTFNYDLSIKGIDGDDQFGKLSKMLFDEKLINILPDGKFFEEFKKEITYWDGNTWVNYPTMNKRYLEAVAKLKLPYKQLTVGNEKFKMKN